VAGPGDAPNAAKSGDATIVGLVLVAAGCVLAAPVLGRAGAPLLAEAAMWIAAGSGIAAFALAGAATHRAARRAGERSADEEMR
jgi:hypothetical protein